MFKQVRLVLLKDYKPKEHTSAHRISMFVGCRRQYGFANLLGLREEKVEEEARPWLRLGHEVEYYQQKYLEGYTIPQETEAGRRALATLHLLPDPKICASLVHQEPIKIDSRQLRPDLELIEVRGAKDLVFQWQGDPTKYLLDYKTTRGNTRKKGGEWEYVKNPDQLRADPQGNMYAWDIMSSTGQETVPGRWVYTLTDLKKHPDARATDVLFLRSDVKARMWGLLEVADWHRAVTRDYVKNPFDPNALPGNPDTCETFGGCPYRPAVGGPCRQPSRTIGQMIMAANNGQPPSDIEAFLADKRQQAMQAGPGGPPPPMAGPGMPPPPPPMAPPQAPQTPQFAPGQVVNGHVLGPDGRWYPAPAAASPQPPTAQAPAPPPPMQPPPMQAAPPQQYQAPPAPHLPPEAYLPPPGAPMGPPSLPGGMGALPPGGHPQGPATTTALPPAATGKGKKATAATADDRTQFVRACALACSTGHALTAAQAKAVADYAAMLWDALQAAGA